MLAEVVYVLTGASALVVLLTRLRLRSRGHSAGRGRVGRGWLALHTVFGLAATVVWVVFLVEPSDTVAGGLLVGVIGLGCWWVTALAGLMMAVRWNPTRGRHSAPTRAAHPAAPWIAALAHLVVVVSAVVFTIAYVFADV